MENTETKFTISSDRKSLDIAQSYTEKITKEELLRQKEHFMKLIDNIDKQLKMFDD